jgi:hypothetical protein
MEMIAIMYHGVVFQGRVEKKYFERPDDIKPLAVLASIDDVLVLCIGKWCKFVDDFQHADNIVVPMIDTPQQRPPPPT